MNRGSLTALGIAVVRAMERERPPQERIVDDPFARHFVGEGMYRFVTFFDKLGWSERRGPGVIGWLMARERAIDDAMLRLLGEGMQQMVILGAGYDARAYRFQRRLAEVKVFEVDHPATQAGKKAKLDKISDELTGDVTLVPVDFESQKLSDRLRESGYDPALRTLFIMQGVIMYLTSDAVDSTLSFIRTQSGPGSAVVFDYVSDALTSGRSAHGEIAHTNSYGRFTGEQIRLGIDPAHAPAWLEARGFVQVEHLRSEDLHARYFLGANAARTVAPGYGLLIARVPAA